MENETHIICCMYQEWARFYFPYPIGRKVMYSGKIFLSRDRMSSV
jgi:hypothetical protein